MTACQPSSTSMNPEDSAMFAREQNYEQFMGRWSRLLAPEFIEFSELSPGGRVLDVGSGTGALSFALIEGESCEEVVGIDPSSSFVNYATDQGPEGRATFEVGDAQELRFEDDSFAHCLSLLVVNFIPDPKKAMAEMARVTQQGGVIAAAVWDYSDGMRMLRVFWDEAIALDPSADARDERHMPYCSENELVDLWRSAGLQEVESGSISIEQRFDSFDAYWQPFLLGTGPAGAYVASLSPEQQESLRKRLQARLDPSGEGGPVVLEAKVWAVKGIVP